MTRLIDAILAIALAAFLLGMIVGRATAAPRSSSHSAFPVPVGATSEAPSSGSGKLPEVRESAVGWHPYPDPVPGGASPSPAALRRPSADPTAAVVHAGDIEGLASWYVWPGHDGLYAALPGPWKPGRTVMVCGPDSECFGGIPVVTSCGCPGGRVIDLSPTAFGRLAPLAVGLTRVTLTVLGGSE